MTATATATRFETLFLDRVWWDRYAINGRDRFETLFDATAAAFEIIADDAESGDQSFDCIRIWDRADDRMIAEWEYCCEDAEPDGEGGMIGVGYAWHRIR